MLTGREHLELFAAIRVQHAVLLSVLIVVPSDSAKKCRSIALKRARLWSQGIPVEHRGAVIDRTLGEMGLRLKADARTGGYSGGNKRKLSVALSMLANPSVNFLDEPSTGVP